MIKVTYKNDEYIYREFYKYYLFRRPTVFAFWIILMATYFMQLATDRGNWELVSFFPLFMFMQIYTYRSKYKLQYKKSCDLTGDAYTYTFTINDKTILFSSTEGISYNIDYDRIRSYALTGGFVFLFTHSKRFYILPIDSFEEGTYKELTDILQSNGVKAEKHAK